MSEQNDLDDLHSIIAEFEDDFWALKVGASNAKSIDVLILDAQDLLDAMKRYRDARAQKNPEG